MLSRLLLSAALIILVNSDCYLHNPRGSNNRLNEKSANRNNGNRAFDSQNNNRGGYNVGDLDAVQGFTGNQYVANFDKKYNAATPTPATANNNMKRQYEEVYIESSTMQVTWTAQHGCGNKKNNCNMVWQYACDTWPREDPTNIARDGGPSNFVAVEKSINSIWGGISPTDKTTKAKMRAMGLATTLFNGGNTNTPQDSQKLTGNTNTDRNNIRNRIQANRNNDRVEQESVISRALCRSTPRNKGLFTADQKLKGTTAQYTRQNPGGTQRGLECPEERDYFPYWRPAPFHDVAVITNDKKHCTTNIAPNSQNVQPKGACLNKNFNTGDTLQNILPPKKCFESLTKTQCDAQTECTWQTFSWGSAAPDCVEAQRSQVNNLGNVDGTERGGQQATYQWKLPTIAQLKAEQCYIYAEKMDSKTYQCARMVGRMRYNISTMDYDPYNTTAAQNQDNNKGVQSPIQQNPTVDVGAHLQGLKLAINTAQTGRTFQDRSHTFMVCGREITNVPAAAKVAPATNVINVNVRGKRGNIVQVFPAVEYDFEPNYLEVEAGDCMHFQWTGSNTHNNGNPAGDGQAGDAGEGRGGSDRSNLVQNFDMQSSYPLTYDKFPDNLFSQLECKWPLNPATTVTAEDAQLILGSGGFYNSKANVQQRGTQNTRLDPLLNNVSASFRQGLMCCVKTTANPPAGGKVYAMMSTRNNNFTNRSQKMKIVIKPKGTAVRPQNGPKTTT